jgi:hypothetical protein
MYVPEHELKLKKEISFLIKEVNKLREYKIPDIQKEESKAYFSSDSEIEIPID